MLALPDASNRRTRSMRPGAQPRAQDNRPAMDDFFGGAMMPSGFGGDIFASMGRMMQEMHSLSQHMFRGMDGAMAELGRGNGNPQFFSRTIQQSTRFDSQGRPLVQTYQTQAYGGTDHDGTRIAERKQYYSDSGSGLEKRAVERKVGDRSRKVVQERLGQEEHRSDLYHNMDERDAGDFDRVWEERSRGLGFQSQHSLPGPSGNSYGRAQPRLDDHRRGGYAPDRHEQQRAREDDYRRGAYMPDSYKREDQPVRVQRPALPASDLQPTVPTGLRTNNPPRAVPAARPAVPRARQGGRAGGTPMPGA
jgi:hypothetical protein